MIDAVYKVHFFLDGKLVSKVRLLAIPRTGETVRFEADVYATVEEVCFCLDEYWSEGQRVNIGTIRIFEEQKDETI